MEDAEGLPPERRRDRIKAMAKRYATVPLSVRTSDLPKRAASAVVMVAVLAGAMWLGGLVLDAFIVVAALACYGELSRLVLRATKSPAWRLSGFAFGAFYIGAAALVLILTDDISLLILLIGAVICVDTFAYFFGRAIGGPKIAPRISPSKTWAGLGGGIVGASIALFVFSAILNYRSLGIWMMPPGGLLLVAEGAVIAVLAQSGDFFESWLKRKAAMKDSSNLIPGHGGVFDRIDGLIPVTILSGIVALAVDPAVLQV